jgi:ribosomal-protein-alanine N-acetyltransferase
MKTSDIFTEIPVLETDNYILRGVSEQDIPELFVFLSDKETMKFITSHPVRTETEVSVTVQNSLQNYKKQKEIPWVIIDKKTDRLIGQFRFYKLNLWHQKTDMNVVISNEHQSTGVMTELMEKVLEFGFESLGLNRIVGDIFAGNERSKKLLKNYGFHKDGVMRQTDFDGKRYHDTVVYSMLKSEYDSNVIRIKQTDTFENDYKNGSAYL